MTKTPFRTDEIATSQLPAMLLLAKMGWKPLTEAQANEARLNRNSTAILEGITRDFLRRQTLTWAGQGVTLNEDNIETLITRLKNLPPATYGKQAEEKWDLLCLPQGVEQVIDGARRSLNTRFIDFDNPENNNYHMASEFTVERSRSKNTRRPDIVLFINGIPMVVIENKSAATDVAEGISQTIRNQKPDNIPQLYVYAQILLSVNKNENRYGTTGTPAKLWNTWREKEIADNTIRSIIDSTLSEEDHRAIFSERGLASSESFMDKAEEGRLITDQDRALVGLCRHDRLLRLTREFILFDGPDKIIARFQQFEAVRKTLERVDAEKNKSGGVIWHTQGSGKSLTMVMLARALISNDASKNARIVLVTDRVDLDKQIKGTFKNTGMNPQRASTGKELIDLIKNSQTGVITTIINKFETAARAQVNDQSSNIFMLVDEGHRSQYGRINAQMRRVFPNATYIAFTGTPIAKQDRNTMLKFGPLIDTYTMRDAVNDGAVIPLIYEGRSVEPEMDGDALDIWFERLTTGLNDTQKADLKKKYNRANILGSLDKIIHCRAFDISEHFRTNYQGTGLKGQLVAPNKLAAVKYKKALDSIGHVTSEILISSPDTRDGHEDVNESKPADEVVAFWGEMMTRWGDEEKYNEGLINQFKYSENPEIIIVVSKLLTGFDAPRNAVLYLTRKLKEHTLLQAIARINRVLDTETDGYTLDKDYGYIVDYHGILEDLSNTLSSYEALAGFEEDDLDGLMRSIGDELEKLPQIHSALLDVFRTLEGNADEEAYEVFLSDEEIRGDFYEHLTAFAKALGVALGSATFYDQTPDQTINRYKRDLKRFINLRTAVKRRYAEEIDFSDYEKKIEKILHDHIGANNIELIVPPINIFNMEMVEEKLNEMTSDRAKADFISNSMKRTITERMAENPAFYKKLSEMIEQIIKDFINDRYAEAEYLKKMREVHHEMANGGVSDIPHDLVDDPHAAAFHGYLLTSPLKEVGASDQDIITFAKKVSTIFNKNRIVDLFQRLDTLNKIRLEIDDYIYDELKAAKKLQLTTQHMDEIQDTIMAIAERRMSK
jgi:type I restriction enzyme R subunit